MEISSHYMTPPHPCSYLPEQTAKLEYVECDSLTVAEYGFLLEQGWRRFGRSLFRPRCSSCVACQSLRVLVNRFAMNRSQRRNAQENADRVTLRIDEPSVDEEKLALHDAFHTRQSEDIGWPRHPPKDVFTYASSFVDNPIPTEEWCYYDREKLIGVGYVDVVPSGLSAIYFFHDPDYRSWGLGTWNVLSVINEAKRRECDYVYLGFFVKGCRSLEYKARFTPHEVLDVTSGWELPLLHSERRT